MGIEGRKQAKEKHRREEDFKVTNGARRKKYVNFKRGPQTDYNEMATPSPDQLDNPRLQQILGEEDILEGEHTFVGVGRGSPVPDYDEVIIEQPRDLERQNETDTGEGGFE